MQPHQQVEPEFAAFVGIDWADREHAWALEVSGAGKREKGKLEQNPESIEAWAAELAARFAGRPIAVSLEQARGALIYALSKYSHLVLYPIHPKTSSAYREAMFPSGSKNDPVDADLLLDLVIHHRKRLRPLQPDTEITRKLQLLVEKRRQLVDQRTAQTNRISDLLKVYFPQILNWFDAVGAPIAQAFLERWPTVEKAQAESSEILRQFFYQHHSRSPERIQERLAEIQKAKAPIQDPAIVEPMQLVTQALLRVVQAFREGIAVLDQAIEKTFAMHPDAPIFKSFPGAGPALAPRLLASFGSQRDRYGSAAEILAYSGIAPVMARSGETQHWTHFRWACPKFLRQSFHEYAEHSMAKCDWAKAFYQRQRKRLGRHAALRSLAFKWVRILFRCWQSATPYQKEVYRRACENRAQPTKPQAAQPRHHQTPRMHPFLAHLEPVIGTTSTAQYYFQTIAGFSKFVVK